MITLSKVQGKMGELLSLTQVVIPSVSASITDGEVRDCVINTLYSSNEIYLALKTDFPRNVDSFIKKTSDFYYNLIRTTRPPRGEMMLSREHLIPGAIVCVHDESAKEWRRAKVVGVAGEVPTRQGENWCKVLLLDLGEYQEIAESDLVYLNPDFAAQPTFSIKTRLELSAYYDDRDLRQGSRWNRAVCEEIQTHIFGKTVQVKFVRKTDQEGEAVWEVSLLRVKDGPDNGPIEQLAIRRRFGSYVKR